MADPIPIDESRLEASQRQFVNMAQLAEVSEELARVKELQLDWRLRQLDDNADKRKELIKYLIVLKKQHTLFLSAIHRSA